jgi:hypothetical protein
LSIRSKPSTDLAAPQESGPTASPTPEENRCEAVEDYSLWEKAYDTLNIEQHDLIVEYEGLLSTALIRGKLIR